MAAVIYGCLLAVPPAKIQYPILHVLPQYKKNPKMADRSRSRSPPREDDNNHAPVHDDNNNHGNGDAPHSHDGGAPVGDNGGGAPAGGEEEVKLYVGNLNYGTFFDFLFFETEKVSSLKLAVRSAEAFHSPHIHSFIHRLTTILPFTLNSNRHQRRHPSYHL